jgi:hypothetical protein
MPEENSNAEIASFEANELAAMGKGEEKEGE